MLGFITVKSDLREKKETLLRSNTRNIYSRLIENIFLKKYKNGDVKVGFRRGDLEIAARELGIELPKNLGDVIYSFKFRASMPNSIAEKTSENKVWIIKNAGRAQYAFEQVTEARILPDNNDVGNQNTRCNAKHSG